MLEQINFQILLDQKYHNPEMLLHLGTLCLEKKQYELALKLLLKIVKVNPDYSQAYKPLARVYDKLRQNDLSYQYYQKLWKNSPSVELGIEMAYFLKSRFKSLQALSFFNEAFQAFCQQPQEIQDNQYSIFFNSLPKSGSTYAFEALLNGLSHKGSYRERAISSRVYFPQDVIRPLNFVSFLQFPTMTKEHLPALPDNIRFLTKYLNKWIVHVRDPRQALFSWFHYLGTLENDQLYSHYRFPAYYKCTREEQLNWQIENHLPLIVEWLMGWKQFAQREIFRQRVLITYFRDLKHRPEQFFEGILRHFGLDNKTFKLPAPPTEGIQLFRKGKEDEWRSYLSSWQQLELNKRIPDELFEFYGWER